MLPQLELDNYKLQVELLQQKLQKSEISRQQLERKLDEILRKRDEHDKMLRSKAKQKYQQFLEEQQRRDERNKQLVQMIERIEQQTEAMNARSERLKMMKLQYEMYFAKLVHSQTRRCIQNSVFTVSPMMATASTQPFPESTMPVIQQTNAESYNCMTNLPHIAKVQHTRDRFECAPTGSMEMPTLNHFVTPEKSYIDFSNLDTTHLIPNHHSYKHQFTHGNVESGQSYNHIKNEIEMSSFADPKINSNRLPSSEVNLILPNDKGFTEFRESSNLSTIPPSTFKGISNSNVTPQISNNLDTSSSNTGNTLKNIQVEDSKNSQQVRRTSLPAQQHIKEISSLSAPNIKTNSISSSENDNKSHCNNMVIEHKSQDIISAKLHDNSPIMEINESIPRVEIPPTSNNTNYINNISESVDIANPINTSLENNSETITPRNTVSIENIENTIYGELLSPSEIREEKTQEISNVDPKLLENLVTQPENIGSDKIHLESESEKKLNEINSANDTIISEPNTSSQNYDPILACDTVSGENTDNQNYDSAIAYDNYNNVQKPQTTNDNMADYINYETINNNATDEVQQQQQYDYSNYDPVQYSYPGYIYDETTGEYKPDPNSSAEQYATDQQYTADGYDQQYQLQEIYDYNQTYTQDPTSVSSTVVDNEVIKNTSQLKESEIITQIETNTEQQCLTEPEATGQSESTYSEISQTSTKITKPTSILSTVDKNDTHKKKKRVNFVDSSETDESVPDKGGALTTKPAGGNTSATSESDFDFSSSTDVEPKTT